MYKCPKHGEMETDWCDECQTLLRCDCSKLETARIKDVGFGDDMTATIYITYCLTCREKHDVSFSDNVSLSHGDESATPQAR